MHTDPIPADLLPEPFTDEQLEYASGTDEVLVANVFERGLTNIDEVEWAMRTLVRLNIARDEYAEKAREWHEQINAWVADAVGPLDRRIGTLERLCVAYGIAHRDANPKAATVLVPSGEIATRRAKEPKVVLADEAAFLEWAADHLDGEAYDRVVKTVESVLISEVRDNVRIAVEANGYDDEITRRVVWPFDDADLVVPGLDVEMPTTTATVRPRA